MYIGTLVKVIQPNRVVYLLYCKKKFYYSQYYVKMYAPTFKFLYNNYTVSKLILLLMMDHAQIEVLCYVKEQEYFIQ